MYVGSGLSLSVLLLGAVAAAGCRAPEDDFYRKVFTCDPGAALDPCGSTRAGRPMTCFRGDRLGGDNFCAEACDPARPPDEPGFRCVAGALLKACRPSVAPDAPSPDCPAELRCYRTDLLGDQGLCLKMQVCRDDIECAVGHRCAGAIIRERYPSVTALATDGLQCVQVICGSGGSSCAPHEVCLANYYVTLPDAPDICVPKCDQDQCPPNFACARSAAAPGSPPVCLPGLLGTRCLSSQDCLVGDCFDTGAGFSECALPLPCAGHADCAFLNGPSATFACVEGVPGAGRRCMVLAPFRGANCASSTECPAGQECLHYSPYVADMGHGECRVPCDDDRPCPVRGGIPHVCLNQGAGGCYPGEFAMPCTSSSECLAGMECLPVQPDPRSFITSPTICTAACPSNDDRECSEHILIRHGGFCGDGVCRMGGQKSDPCDRDAQCLHGLCTFDPAGDGRCAN